MSKITKGILGGCSGKIGNIMGYQRNGKAIIQRVPRIEKSKNPIGRMSKAPIREFLIEPLSTLSATSKAPWLVFFGFPVYDLGLVLDYNMQLANSLHSININNLVYTQPINSPSIDFSGSINYTTRTVSLHLNPLFDHSLLAPFTLVRLLKFNFVGGAALVDQTPVNPRANLYHLQYTQIDYSSAKYFLIFFQAPTTATRSQILFIDPQTSRL